MDDAVRQLHVELFVVVRATCDDIGIEMNETKAEMNETRAACGRTRSSWLPSGQSTQSARHREERGRERSG
jgi:hypothetical protein